MKNTRLKLILSFGAVLALLLQVFVSSNVGKLELVDSEASVAQVQNAQENQQVENRDLANTHEDGFPDSHHHCKSCPASVCCAYLNVSLAIEAPSSVEKKYLDFSSFWFYELISSQLRPPAFTC